MNEKIKQLWDNSIEEFSKQHQYATIMLPEPLREKFVELIVKECAQYMYEHYPHSLYEVNYMRKHMGDADWNKPIKQHFGVEE